MDYTYIIYILNIYYIFFIKLNIVISDINECEDPAIAARCVEHAECCNLPAHFICKCNRGFEGDGEEECRGIIKKIP